MPRVVPLRRSYRAVEAVEAMCSSMMLQTLQSGTNDYSKSMDAFYIRVEKCCVTDTLWDSKQLDKFPWNWAAANDITAREFELLIYICLRSHFKRNTNPFKDEYTFEGYLDLKNHILRAHRDNYSTVTKTSRLFSINLFKMKMIPEGSNSQNIHDIYNIFRKYIITI